MQSQFSVGSDWKVSVAKSIKPWSAFLVHTPFVSVFFDQIALNIKRKAILFKQGSSIAALLS